MTREPRLAARGNLSFNHYSAEEVNIGKSLQKSFPQAFLVSTSALSIRLLFICLWAVDELFIILLNDLLKCLLCGNDTSPHLLKRRWIQENQSKINRSFTTVDVTDMCFYCVGSLLLFERLLWRLDLFPLKGAQNDSPLFGTSLNNTPAVTRTRSLYWMLQTPQQSVYLTCQY